MFMTTLHHTHFSDTYESAPALEPSTGRNSNTTLSLHTSATLIVLHGYCVEHMPECCTKHPDGAEQCSYPMGKVRKSTQHPIKYVCVCV